jgi:hypothetical protein
MKFVKFEECRHALSIFLADKNMATLSVKARIINGIATLLKEKSENQLPHDLIKIVNATFIDSRYLTKDRDVLKFKKKKLTKKLYREQEIEKKKEK